MKSPEDIRAEADEFSDKSQEAADRDDQAMAIFYAQKAAALYAEADRIEGNGR